MAKPAKIRIQYLKGLFEVRMANPVKKRIQYRVGLGVVILKIIICKIKAIHAVSP